MEFDKDRIATSRRALADALRSIPKRTYLVELKNLSRDYAGFVKIENITYSIYLIRPDQPIPVPSSGNPYKETVVLTIDKDTGDRIVWEGSVHEIIFDISKYKSEFEKSSME